MSEPISASKILTQLHLADRTDILVGFMTPCIGGESSRSDFYLFADRDCTYGYPFLPRDVTSGLPVYSSTHPDVCPPNSTRENAFKDYTISLYGEETWRTFRDLGTSSISSEEMG